MNEQQFYVSTEQLREEYERRSKRVPPKRARGIPWGLAVLLFQIPAVILVAMGLSNIINLDFEDFEVALVLAFFVTFPLMYLFDWPTKTWFYSSYHYPKLRKSIQQLNEPGSRAWRCLPVLRIEKQDVFLVHYVGRNRERNGWALLNSDGSFIQNPDLLEKAYQTFILAILGGDDFYLNSSDNQRYGWGLHTVRKILPKAAKILDEQEKEFSRHNLSMQWNVLKHHLPLLSEAMRSGLQIYATKNQWRRALGWNAGKIYLYEDAKEYLGMCLAYSQYMAAAYGTALVEIINAVNQAMYTVNMETDWRGRKRVRWALSMLLAAAKGVESWIFTYGVLGKVTEKEMGWYRRKLNRAREVGLTVVRE